MQRKNPGEIESLQPGIKNVRFLLHLLTPVTITTLIIFVYKKSQSFEILFSVLLPFRFVSLVEIFSVPFPFRGKFVGVDTRLNSTVVPRVSVSRRTLQCQVRHFTPTYGMIKELQLLKLCDK